MFSDRPKVPLRCGCPSCPNPKANIPWAHQTCGGKLYLDIWEFTRIFRMFIKLAKNTKSTKEFHL